MTLSNASASVTGNVVISNALTTTNVFATRYYGDGGLLSNVAGGSSQWTTAGSNIYFATGNVAIGTSTYNGYTLQVNGSIGAAGDVVSFYSDDRLKTRTGVLTSALEKICSLDTFTYKNNDLARSLGFDDDVERVGLSAQQVQKILPEAVKPAPFNPDYLTVQYDKIVPLLVEAVKDLHKLIGMRDTTPPATVDPVVDTK
jgi:hypothetical protein